MVVDGDATARAVDVRGLGRSFASLDAVRDLSFDVAPGEIFGIVGPDGAGKTTTIRMLAGVLPPTTGTAAVLGVDVATDPERVKAKIAYMAQRFGLYEDLTVAENIAFYADLYRVPAADRPERLDRLYAFAGLGPFRQRLVGQLSGGMKQKASLCCALIHRPELLLLDEPTFGVDPISRRELWIILHEMAAEGMTIVLTTSYLDEAERCDRVALIDHGQRLALGEPAALQRAFPGRLLSIPSTRDRALHDRLAHLPAVRSVIPFGDRAHILLHDAEGETLVREALRAAGVDTAEVTVIEASLEDVFLERVAAARREDAHV